MMGTIKNCCPSEEDETSITRPAWLHTGLPSWRPQNCRHLWKHTSTVTAYASVQRFSWVALEIEWQNQGRGRKTPINIGNQGEAEEVPPEVPVSHITMYRGGILWSLCKEEPRKGIKRIQRTPMATKAAINKTEGSVGQEALTQFR